jgi:hypothetical protein
METNRIDEAKQKMDEACTLMERALALLDEADAPADVGAHLDMAICRLKASSSDVPVSQPGEPPYSQESCAWPIRPAA